MKIVKLYGYPQMSVKTSEEEKKQQLETELSLKIGCEVAISNNCYPETEAITRESLKASYLHLQEKMHGLGNLKKKYNIYSGSGSPAISPQSPPASFPANSHQSPAISPVGKQRLRKVKQFQCYHVFPLFLSWREPVLVARPI